MENIGSFFCDEREEGGEGVIQGPVVFALGVNLKNGKSVCSLIVTYGFRASDRGLFAICRRLFHGRSYVTGIILQIFSFDLGLFVCFRVVFTRSVLEYIFKENSITGLRFTVCDSLLFYSSFVRPPSRNCLAFYVLESDRK